MLALAAVFALPVLPGASGTAHANALVSNIETTLTDRTRSLGTTDRAQGFTTGGYAASYTMTGVDLHLHFQGGTKPSFTVGIYSSSSGRPGTRLGTLRAPASLRSGINAFTHSGIDLAANTTYFVVVDVTSTGIASVYTTREDSQTGAAGWSIADESRYRSWNCGSCNWLPDSYAMRMRINGMAKRNIVTGGPVTVQTGSSTRVDEGETRLSHRIRLSKRPSGNVTITLSSDDPSIATAEPAKFVPALTFTRKNWYRWQEVVVRGVNDNRVNPVVERFYNRRGRSTLIRHHVSGGGLDGAAVSDVLVFVYDDDASGRPTGVEVTLSPPRIDEGGGTQRITVTATLLGGTLLESHRFDVFCESGPDATAEEGSDFACPSRSNFPFWGGSPSMSTSIKVTPADDSETEDDETLTIRVGLKDPATGTTHTATAPLTIVDNDQPATIEAVDSLVREGERPRFKVTLSQPAKSDRIRNGQLMYYRAYDPAGSSFLHWRETDGNNAFIVPAGATTHTFFVYTVDDRNDEPHGDVRVELVDGKGYSVGNPSSATVRVLDNEPGATAEASVADARVTEAAGVTLDFTVTLDQAPGSAVTVDYATADGTATAGEDYTHDERHARLRRERDGEDDLGAGAGR